MADVCGSGVVPNEFIKAGPLPVHEKRGKRAATLIRSLAMQISSSFRKWNISGVTLMQTSLELFSGRPATNPNKLCQQEMASPTISTRVTATVPTCRTHYAVRGYGHDDR